MYSTIRTYINTLISTINSGITGTADDFIEVSTLMDSDNLPANLSNKSYLILIESTQDNSNESVKYLDVNVKIQFWFLLANKVANYETAIDTYLRKIKMALRKKAFYKGSDFAITGIQDLRMNELDKLIEGGTYLNPSITFTYNCTDNS